MPNENENEKPEEPRKDDDTLGGFSKEDLDALISRMEERKAKETHSPLALSEEQKMEILKCLYVIGDCCSKACGAVGRLDGICMEIERKQERSERLLGMDRNAMRSLLTVVLMTVHRDMGLVDPVTFKSRDLPVNL